MEQLQNDFVQLILDMRGGQVATDINDKLNEVIRGVLDTGIKGELSLKITVKPSKMGMGGSVIEVEIEHEAKSKVPELPIGRSVFFVDPRGHLTREDPSQTAMFQNQEIKQ